MTDGWDELRREIREALPDAHCGPEWRSRHAPECRQEDYEEVMARLVPLLAAARGEPPEAAEGTCWFCKGRFVIDALIAGYDTFEEQRLACLACNERISGNWHATPEPDPERRCPNCDSGKRSHRGFAAGDAPIPCGDPWHATPEPDQ